MAQELRIDISDPMTAWPKLFAAMTYPKDPVRWAGFTTLFDMRSTHYFLNGKVWDLNEQDDDRARDAAFKGPGQLAGAVLCFTAQLHLFHPTEKVSINRAWNILHKDKASLAISKPKHKSGFYDNVWSTWKCVSPLRASFLIKRNVDGIEMQSAGTYDRWGSAKLGEFLGWADWFRQWATSTKADKASSTFLSADDVLAVVSDASPLTPPITAFRVGRLPAAQ